MSENNDDTLEVKLRNLLKCNACLHFLTPPLLQCEESHIICGTCSKTKSKCPKCDSTFSKIKIPILTDAIHLIKFPCCYADIGCGARLTWDEILDHESECYWRVYTCPKCPWSGRGFDLKQHFEENHANSIIRIDDEFVTSLDDSDSVTTLLATNDNVFIYTMRKDAIQIWFGLQLIGKKEDAKALQYSLEIKNPAVKLYLTQQQQVLYDFEKIEPHVGINLTLNLLQMFRQGRDVTIHIRIIPKPSGLSKVTPALLNKLRCPICLEFMVRTVINLCENGHSFCNNCRLQVTSCPICRVRINNSRNYTLEGLCQEINFS